MDPGLFLFDIATENRSLGCCSFFVVVVVALLSKVLHRFDRTFWVV